MVTELPYLVGPERVPRQGEGAGERGPAGGVDADGIADLERHERLAHPDRREAGGQPASGVAGVYRLTPLEETFGVINVVLVTAYRPRSASTTCAALHRAPARGDRPAYGVPARQGPRSAPHPRGPADRADAIDEVVAIIRSSQDASEARQRLIERFSLSEIQAAHILDMPLRRLTAFAKIGDRGGGRGLRADIDEYEKLLASEARRRTLVLKELQELVDRHGSDRRAEIVAFDDIPVFEAPSNPAETFDPDSDEPCLVTLSTSGNLGRSPADETKRATAGRHDLLVAQVVTSTGSPVGVVTTEGRIFVVRGGEVADASGRTRGAPAAQLLGLNKGEEPLALVAAGDEPVVVVTAQGVAKRLTAEEALETRSGKTVINLKPGDSVVSAFRAPDGVDMAIVASDAQVLRLPVDSVSVQGRGAGGVAGMRLRDGASAVGAGPLIGDGAAIIVTDASGLKATPYEELPVKGRGGQGVRLSKLGDGETVTQAWFGAMPADLLAQMADDDDPRKLDPNPVALDPEPSGRDLVPARTERQILVLAPARW
ncbi:MAG: DNA gyrase C-terminal beta-propeller domain-containing protein [Acidimicrobiales bacterium]